ncbi:MAG: hypothetical protein ACREUT_05310 [Steroidobacteraceae bacterium]
MKTYAISRKFRVLLLLPILAIGGCAAMGFGYGVDPYGMDPYGYGVGLDPYGYPYADWYGGYAYGPSAVIPYTGSALGGAPHPGREIQPHRGPRPHRGPGSNHRSARRTTSSGVWTK